MKNWLFLKFEIQFSHPAKTFVQHSIFHLNLHLHYGGNFGVAHEIKLKFPFHNIFYYQIEKINIARYFIFKMV